MRGVYHNGSGMGEGFDILGGRQKRSLLQWKERGVYYSKSIRGVCYCGGGEGGRREVYYGRGQGGDLLPEVLGGWYMGRGQNGVGAYESDLSDKHVISPYNIHT